MSPRLLILLSLMSVLTSCGWTTLKFDNKLSISGRFLAEPTTSSLTTQNSTINALSCVAPIAYLSRLNAQGERELQPVAEAKIANDGLYTFKLSDASLLSGSQALIIDVKGCSSGTYSRPVTASTNQDVTIGSSLISYMLNSDKREDVVEALTHSTSQMSTLLSTIAPAMNFQDAYTLASTNTRIQDLFNDLFDTAPSTLLTSFPEVMDLQVPTTAQELQATPLVVQATHWSSSYSTVYTWKFDTQVLGHSNSLSWTPGANAQGTHSITLLMGENNGSGEVDLTKPHREMVRSITLTNNILPQAPALSAITPVVSGTTPINTTSITLGVATGASRIYCSSFSSMAITEQTVNQPSASAFTYNCTSAGVQSLPYTLTSTGDGEKTLSLWVRDASGTISATPSTLTFFLDRGVPVTSITSSNVVLDNQSSRSFSFSALDDGGIIARYECQLDAASYTSCSTPATYTSLTDGSHTFRVRAIDTAGNISTPATQTWVTDRTSPIASFSSTPSSITNQLSGTFNFSASDSSGNAIQGYVCSVDGATASSCISPFVTILAAGSHSVSITARDAANNLSTPLTYSWTIDTALPTTTIGSKPASTTNSTSASFSFSATDTGGGTVASYECSLDSATFATCASPQTYSSLVNSAHTFRVRATDTAGNVSTIASYAWVVDTTTPLASINSAPDSITNSDTANFSFSANPPPAGSITGYLCSIDGAAYASCTSPKSYGSLIQGSHTFSVKSVDNNSAISDPVTHSWVVDLTNPVATYSATPASLVAVSSANFTFSATDTGGGSIAGYQCKLDASSYVTCSSPYSISSLTDGSHTMSVRATDTAGNVSSAVAHTWTVDTSAPVLNLASTPSALTNALTASFVFSATDAVAVSSYRCTLDGGASATCTSPLNLSSLAAGSHSFAVTATDSSGNTSTATTFNWTIDTTAPTVSLSSTPLTFTNLTTANFSFSGSDTGGATIANYNCKIDAGSYSSCASPHDFTGLSAGTHTFSMTVTDTAGNTSSPISYSWTIDTTPPTVTITTPASNATVANIASLTSYSVGGGCSENGIVVTIAGSLNATATCSSGTWSTNVSLSMLSDGLQSITASQTDISGNMSTVATRTFIKDTLAPVIAVGTPTGFRGNGSYGSASFTLTELNPVTGSNFSIELFNGTSWISAGVKVVTASPNSATAYTLSPFSVPNVNVTTARLRVSFTDAAGNSSQVTSSTFPIQSTPPSVSSFSIAQGSSTSVQNIQVGLTASDPMTPITHFCVLQNSTTTPSLIDSCWKAVNAPSPGISPSKNITFSGFFYSLGFTTGNYSLYAFVKNGLGLISALSNSGAGADGADKAVIFYTSPLPPTVTNVLSTNTDVPAYPTNSADQIVAPGGNVYVKWKASDSVGFGSAAIALEYTLDGTNYIPVVGNLVNGQNGGCTPDSPSTAADDGNTGCYVWSGGAPIGYFAVRVRATNLANLSASNQGAFMNPGKIVILAGNIDTGVSGSAKSAIIKTRKNSAVPISQQFAVLPDGKIIINDFTYGIVMVDPSDGIYSVLIPSGATESTEGDNGPVSGAKVKAVSQLTVDYHGNIYLWDYERIRKITTTVSPWTIKTIIGGGSVDRGTDILGTALRVSVQTPGSYIVYFSARPDGSVWLIPNNYGSPLNHSTPPTVYSYNPLTEKVTIQGSFSGTGLNWNSSYDLTPLYISNGRVALSYDPMTSATLSILAGVQGDGSVFGTTRFNPTTFVANASDPLASPYGDYFGSTHTAIVGLDGKIYIIDKFGLINRWDDATSTMSPIVATSTGICVDGTLLANCKMNVQDLFVDNNGKPFFLDNGTIRTLDNSGKLVTLAGQPSTFGDGLEGKEARFGDVKSIATTTAGDVFILDSENLRIRKWSRSTKLISKVAGNNSNSIPNVNDPAASQGIFYDIYVNTANIEALKSTGELIYNRENSIAKLSSVTGKWVDLAGNGNTPYTVADNLPLDQVRMRVAYAPKIIGLKNSDTLLVSMGAWGGNYIDGMLKTYDMATGTQIPFAGITGITAPNGLPADNSVLATTLFPHATGVTKMTYDATSDAWFAYSGSSMKKLVQGGTITNVFTDNSVYFIDALTVTRKNGFIVAYYCAENSTSASLRKWEEETNTITPLPWPSTRIKCRSDKLDYNPTLNTLIFGFELGGQPGVAEFTGP